MHCVLQCTVYANEYMVTLLEGVLAVYCQRGVFKYEG